MILILPEIKIENRIRSFIAILIIDKDNTIQFVFRKMSYSYNVYYLYINLYIKNNIAQNNTKSKRDRNPYNPIVRRGILIPLIMML